MKKNKKKRTLISDEDLSLYSIDVSYKEKNLIKGFPNVDVNKSIVTVKIDTYKTVLSE